jgi:hypothetical protein
MQRPPRDPKRDRLVSTPLLLYSYAIAGEFAYARAPPLVCVSVRVRVHPVGARSPVRHLPHHWLLSCNNPRHVPALPSDRTPCPAPTLPLRVQAPPRC